MNDTTQCLIRDYSYKFNGFTKRKYICISYPIPIKYINRYPCKYEYIYIFNDKPEKIHPLFHTLYISHNERGGSYENERIDNISNSIIELLQHEDQINKTLGMELIKAQINK